MTERLQRVGQVIGIESLDHLVVRSERYYSTVAFCSPVSRYPDFERLLVGGPAEVRTLPISPV